MFSFVRTRHAVSVAAAPFHTPTECANLSMSPPTLFSVTSYTLFLAVAIPREVRWCLVAVHCVAVRVRHGWARSRVPGGHGGLSGEIAYSSPLPVFSRVEGVLSQPGHCPVSDLPFHRLLSLLILGCVFYWDVGGSLSCCHLLTCEHRTPVLSGADFGLGSAHLRGRLALGVGKKGHHGCDLLSRVSSGQLDLWLMSQICKC